MPVASSIKKGGNASRSVIAAVLALKNRTRTQARAGTRTPIRIGAPMTEPIFDHDRLDVYRLAIQYVASSFAIAKDLKGHHRHARDQ